MPWRSHGITVTASLVTTVKSKHNKKHAAKKAAKTATSRPCQADKKPEVNKSQAIRDYLKANKKAKAQEVVDALAREGITVSVGLVTNVKSKSKKRRRAVKTGCRECRRRRWRWRPRDQGGLCLPQGRRKRGGGEGGPCGGFGDQEGRVGATSLLSSTTIRVSAFRSSGRISASQISRGA